MDRREVILRGLKYGLVVSAASTPPAIMYGLSVITDMQAPMAVGKVDIVRARIKSSSTGIEVVGGANIVAEADWHTGVQELRASLMFSDNQGQTYTNVGLPDGVDAEVVSLVDLGNQLHNNPKILVHFGRTSGSTRFKHASFEFGIFDTSKRTFSAVLADRFYGLGSIDSVDITNPASITIHGKAFDMPQDTRSSVRTLGILDIQINHISNRLVGANFTPFQRGP